MYLIANNSKSEITITDLNISLRPKQALDLHKIRSSDEIEKSKNLKSAISSGRIKFLHKEANNAKKEEKTEIIVQNQFDKEGLLKDIQALLSKEVDSKIEKLNTTQENNFIQNERLLILLQSIQKNMSKSSTVDVEKKNIIEDISISSDKIIEMHSRAVGKMSKNVEGNIISPGKKVKDENVVGNANELDKLI